MSLPVCREKLRKAGIPASPVVPLGSPLHNCAIAAACMVSSYLDDGEVFFEAGNLKDCLASYAYALGWHDAAAGLGLFEGGIIGPEIILSALSGNEMYPGLPAKQKKYSGMLERAIDAVTPGPDPESCLFPWAAGVVSLARSSREKGEESSRAGRDQEALFWFSYGYGWLDFGVRAGALLVRRDRSLFTL